MNLKLIVSGQNITVFVNNGDRAGHTPNENNEILLEGLSYNTIEVDPGSSDRIVAVVTQTTEG